MTNITGIQLSHKDGRMKASYPQYRALQKQVRVTEKKQPESEFPVSLSPYLIHIPELVLHVHMYVYRGKSDKYERQCGA